MRKPAYKIKLVECGWTLHVKVSWEVQELDCRYFLNLRYISSEGSKQVRLADSVLRHAECIHANAGSTIQLMPLYCSSRLIAKG